MHRPVAFADEFGNNSFEFSSQGTHFIVASIILEEHNIELLESQVEAIRSKYFQTGEIKSNKVGKSHKRREIILKELTKLDFTIYAVVVDKRELSGAGFKYKPVFYKYLNGLVYSELYNSFANLSLVVDEMGGNDFMRKFKSYVMENHTAGLFQEFSFYKSHTNLLVQVADFIAGTLGYCFDESKRGEHSEMFLEIIKPKLASIEFYPRIFTPLTISNDNSRHVEDNKVKESARMHAISFVKERQRKGLERQEHADQVSFVKLLLLYQTTYTKNGFVSAQELMKHLNAGRNPKINDQYFRAKIIGKLRDKGLLIASNSKGEEPGYKLPNTVNDLNKFIDHNNSMIIPLLHRVKKCRDSIKLITGNQFDILDREEYKEMKSIIDSMGL